MMLMTGSMNENPLFDPPGAIFTGISGMADCIIVKNHLRGMTITKKERPWMSRIYPAV